MFNRPTAVQLLTWFAMSIFSLTCLLRMLNWIKQLEYTCTLHSLQVYLECTIFDRKWFSKSYREFESAYYWHLHRERSFCPLSSPLKRSGLNQTPMPSEDDFWMYLFSHIYPRHFRWYLTKQSTQPNVICVQYILMKGNQNIYMNTSKKSLKIFFSKTQNCSKLCRSILRYLKSSFCFFPNHGPWG